jgi:thiol-disulfide isomerase/thioredoxin
MNEAWPSEFVWMDPLPPPRAWEKPGVVMFFNLECPGCIARGIPFLKALAGEFGDRLHYLTVHTAYGHRRYPAEDVRAKVRAFAESFARLPFPVGLDLSGALAERLGVEGTPHWLVYAPGGELVRSIYGSQDNARTRLAYLMEELTQGA